MKLAVIGTGYVGLASGACYAELGNQVYCIDIDQEKIEGLKKGKMPIYDPELDALIANNHAEGRLHFTNNLTEALEDCSLYFIDVGTPPVEDGSADLQYVLAVAKEIGSLLTDYAIIVNNSTVPVSTADKVREAVQTELDRRGLALEFNVVSYPEI